MVEEFLEDINNMLNSGEVPNLFEKDELEQVLAATRPKAKEAGISEENRDEVHTPTQTLCIPSGSTNVALYIYNMYKQWVMCQTLSWPGTVTQRVLSERYK